MAVADKSIEDDLDDVESKKPTWIEQFQKLGEKRIVEQLEKIELEEVVEDEIFQQLKNAASDEKAVSYVETMKKDVEEILGLNRSTFDIEKYEDRSKTEIAQELAKYFVNTLNIRPTYIGNEDEEVTFYKYNLKTGVWEYISQAQIKTKGMQLAGKEFTSHFKRELMNNLRYHPKKLRLRNMGTSNEWLPIANGGKLYIGELSEEMSSVKHLETEELERTDQAMHRLSLDYDPEAECPRFEKFVYQLLDQKEHQVKTLQEFLGWTLKYPDRKFKKALLILGVTNSGKSQLTDVVHHLWADNASKSITRLSLPQMGFERTFHVNQLEHSIINIDSDLSGRHIENPSIIKKATAQETLSVEPKGEDAYQINPKTKHVIASNVSPEIENQDDDAFYERFLTLIAPNSVPREDRVKDLGKKLVEEEGSGILNWMLQGLNRLEKNGEFTIMRDPDETKKLWWRFGDSIHRFLWQACTVTQEPEDYIPKDDLYEWYENWFNQNPNVKQKVSSRAFKEEVNKVKEIGEERITVSGIRSMCFTNLKVDTDKLMNPEEELEDDRPEEEIET